MFDAKVRDKQNECPISMAYRSDCPGCSLDERSRILGQKLERYGATMDAFLEVKLYTTIECLLPDTCLSHEMHR